METNEYTQDALDAIILTISELCHSLQADNVSMMKENLSVSKMYLTRAINDIDAAVDQERMKAQQKKPTVLISLDQWNEFVNLALIKGYKSDSEQTRMYTAIASARLIEGTE